MNFSDIFKQSFLDGFVGTELGFKEILMVFLITACLAAYIFLVYRVVTRRTFYSKNFNIALAMLCMITAAVILTIQFSIVISLGMVGALSIVRFRTAVKDPMDLVFLFWSIGTGIICGAGLAEIAVILALLLTAGVLLLDRLPVVSVPVLAEGIFQTKEELVSLLGPSNYISNRKTETLRQTSEKLGLDPDRQCRETDDTNLMEGLYIKVEENGQVVDRLKFVRPSFTQTVEMSSTHWLDRPIVPNGLSISMDELYLPRLPGKG